eukprot:TRINITY_DN13538_c0_g1_i2.p1 TRINITY_DN13538_c0_g1~~TRINITY_DN13538_c0_g1_i2.p1  ORF type:complete len:143 (-),score=5.04 TRINITY_DN13538_c0_g1_i2:464-892(-)
MKIQEVTKEERRQEEEVPKLAETLHKLYSVYHESVNRLSPDIRSSSRFTVDPNNMASYMYAPPETLFTASPEVQAEAAAKLIDDVRKVPTVMPMILYPDELQKVSLQVTASECRKCSWTSRQKEICNRSYCRRSKEEWTNSI